ncbi:hypothetical protein IEQ34_009824 [Dendrobium chrysotoxum]|uniref:KOW domain-containing protein n=1 Tax=Dendrobium chrysotoxum TaxID=161865 RepID=A0AAV7H2H6_DENCH|nr:hypothetical protein IEQ34_009824 [Dendrobium chrysotoxum]
MAVKGKGKQIAGKSPASSASSSGKRKRSRADGESSGAPPKKKPSGVLQFVDDAAADADFEGEEEEDDLDWEIDDDFDFELPDIGAKEVKNVTRGPGKSSPVPFFIKEEEMNDDELEEAIKERYRGSGFVSFDEDVKECDQSLFAAHATKDLSVWRMGRERQAAFCLMQKFVDLQKIGKKLQIFSVFALDHVKGFFYVEADRACNVFEACNGLCILYPSRIELVPRNEAPNLLSIQRKACGIFKGMWVRMKNGKYKGDLAEVVLVNDAKKRVTIKLVPRIDLQAISKKFGGGTSLKAAAIPAPRLISSHELEDFRPHIEVRRDRETGEIFEVLDGLMLKDGYLYKKVSMGSLIHWGVQPTSDELMKFEELDKDEVKDVGWLSSIYKARMNKKLPETSHQKNGEKYNQKDGEKSNPKVGEKSNQKDADKQINGFDIDDLVLFGKKSCGIIIDKENDTFKVLKGDVNGSEVVSINIRVIKKICVDKVFTATDRFMKTISIDDVVKVSEGPLEGREGIVRHMYKGVLFIYDECQSENNGFFCANSGICDLVKKSRDLGGGKLSTRAGPSFAQSPIRLSEQDDNSQSFSRNQQSNSHGTFSVGQTLRIRKGPLKGYLCRVIRMRRADITVKLDSLGKLLTVDEKLLSLPNSKRDDATAMQCNMFGSQEEQSTDGLLDAGGGLGMDNFEFNAGMSSFGRDSWNTPSCSSFSFPRENDSKDQNQIADPWGSKLSSWNGDQEQGPANRGKAPSVSAEQSSWNKVESGEKGADAKCKNDVDAWNKASTKVETSTSGWPNDTPVQKTGQTWCSNGDGDGDGFDSAAHTAVEGVSDAVGWSKAKFSTPDSGKGRILGEDSWNKAASKPPILSDTETIGWEQTKLPSSDAGGSWNTNGATADWKKDTSGKDRADGFSGQSGNWASPKSVGGDNQDSWSINEKGFVGNNEDGWGKSAASQEIKPVAKSTWQTSFNSSVQSKTCKTPSADENQASDWGASSLERSSQTSSWDKEKTAPGHIGVVKSEHEEIGGWKKATEGKQADGCAASAMHAGTSSVEEGSQSNSWGKLKSLPSSSGWEKSTETVRSWKTTTDSRQAAGWGSTSMPLATPSVEHESQTNSWDKQSASPSFDGLQKFKQADATVKEGWKKDGFSSEGQIDGWNKEKSSDRDQASDWNKAGNAEVGKDVLTDSWDKAKSSEGRGFGQESQGHWKAGGGWHNDHHDPNFGKSKDSDSGQGSGWSQGHFNNESGNNWGHGNRWDQQRDFDGGRGSSRGRGRGRYGGRGGRNEDNFEKPGDSDGGWRFGRGRGRGRNGAGGYSRDNSDTREFGRGRGHGHRGQGRQGQFESSDWRNRQERFDGGFSNKPSSWGNTDGGNDGCKSTDGHSAAGMDEKVGWNSGNSYGGGSRPGWGTDPQDAGGNTNDTNVDNASSWSKDVDTGKQIDNWSKLTRSNDNWNTPKTSDTKPSSWNQTIIDTAKGDATSSQSTDWKMNTPNSPDVSFVDWAHGLPVTKGGTTNDDKWTSAKSSTGDHCDTSSGNLKSNNWCETATLNKENEAGDNQGGWTSKKVDTQASQTSSENENNWGKCKEPCSGSTADGSGNLGSSKDWGNKNLANLDSRSSVWDSKKEPTSSHGNWDAKDSSGDQSSDWNNGGGNKWSKQSGGQGKSESWNRGSDFGRGGGKGRDNSFSRGRGLGRNSGGRHSYGWNGSDDSGKEGNDGGQAFKTGGSWSRGHGTFEGEKESWNSGGNAEKGSWGSWKSGESPTRQVQGSGWAASASASVSMVERSSADASQNLGSSKDWPDNSNSADCNLRSSAWGSKQEPTSTQGNWGGNDSSGNQASDWDNDGGNKWNKQSGSQGKSESWSRGSFGRGGAGSFGRGGRRGRDNSFSSRGRGPGRNYGSCGSSKEGTDGWQAFNSNQEFKTGGSWNRGNGTLEGEKGSWNSGGNTEKASWGSLKSEAGLAKPGWEGDSSKSSWDSPTGIGSNMASGWESASAKDLVTEQSGQQKNNPWGSANVSKMGQGSSCNNEKSTWDSGSSDEKQKNHLSETGHVGSWDAKNAPSEDENSNKPQSWNVKGSGWSSEPGAAEGSLPVQAEAPKWQTSRSTTTDSSSKDAFQEGGDQRNCWGKADNSGNGGANSGW